MTDDAAHIRRVLNNHHSYFQRET